MFVAIETFLFGFTKNNHLFTTCIKPLVSYMYPGNVQYCFFAQISTSAGVAMVGVTRSVQTTLAPSCAAVTLDSNWLAMDKLALVRVAGLDVLLWTV